MKIDSQTTKFNYRCHDEADGAGQTDGVRVESSEQVLVNAHQLQVIVDGHEDVGGEQYGCSEGTRKKRLFTMFQHKIRLALWTNPRRTPPCSPIAEFRANRPRLMRLALVLGQSLNQILSAVNGRSPGDPKIVFVLMKLAANERATGKTSRLRSPTR